MIIDILSFQNYADNATRVCTFIRMCIYLEQGDIDDVQEITAVWTYFRDNQVEQLFKFFKKNFGKGDTFLSKFYFVLFIHIYFNKKGKTKQNKSPYFNNIEICQFYTS